MDVMRLVISFIFCLKSSCPKSWEEKQSSLDRADFVSFVHIFFSKSQAASQSKGDEMREWPAKLEPWPDQIQRNYRGLDGAGDTASDWIWSTNLVLEWQGFPSTSSFFLLLLSLSGRSKTRIQLVYTLFDLEEQLIIWLTDLYVRRYIRLTKSHIISHQIHENTGSLGNHSVIWSNSQDSSGAKKRTPRQSQGNWLLLLWVCTFLPLRLQNRIWCLLCSILTHFTLSQLTISSTFAFFHLSSFRGRGKGERMMMRFRSGNGIWIMTNKKEYELRPLDLLFSFICINVISLVYDTRVPAAS